MTVTLNGLDDFGLSQFRRVAWDGEAVAIGADGERAMAEARSAFMAYVDDPERVVYGVTSGYGDSAGQHLDAAGRKAMAESPPYHLGVGFGPAYPLRLARGILFARLANFVSGLSAVRPRLAHEVAALLDGRDVPVLHRHGQMSSGEVEQLLPLIGHLIGPGRAEKEASALLNGSPCAAALLSDAALRARHRVGVMARVLALATDAAGLPEEAWDPALARASRDRWMGPAFATLAALRQGAARPRRAWQPPVSFRIAPQLLAAAMRAADQAASAAADWLATVTDNPTFFTDEPAYEAGRVLTNGGFHNPVATPHLATLAFVSADLATLAGRLVTKLHDERVTGLTNALAPAGTKLSTQRLRAVQMWFTERARDAAQPAFIPASDGGVLQSDIFLPAFPAYDKEETAADACLGAFACLAATASQALWADGDRAPAPPLRPALAAVRAVFPPVDTVRDQGAALARLIAALQEACLGNRPELAGNHAADRPFASHSPAPEPDDGDRS